MRSTLILPLLLASLGSLPLARVPAQASQPTNKARQATEASKHDIWSMIREQGFEHSKVMDYLDTLTNSIGPRLTGSDNFSLACNWAAKEFKKMGLKVKLEPWAEWNFVFNRGQWMGRSTKPEKMELQVATEAWTAGTRGAVTAAAVLAPKALEDLASLEGKLRGKWLLARRPSRRNRAARKNWTNLLRFAEAQGAAGLVYPSQGDARYPNRIRVFGSYRTVLAANAKIPSFPRICVRKDQWKKLAKWLADDKQVELNFDIRNRFRREKVVLHNVIADIVGSKKPDEMVIVCGHLDSWHQATGTTDNGTGTTSTMEAARILAAAGAKPERTIRFILWGGEEQGLLGSRAYVQKHRRELAKISAVFNHDTGTNWAQNIGVPKDMFADFSKIIAPLAAIKAPDAKFQGNTFRLGKRKSIGGGRGGGSDHASFLAADVPAWSWGLKGRSNYFQHTWHSQWDTFDVAIPEYQRHTSVVIATVALGVANLPHLLSRKYVGRAGLKTLKAEARAAAKAGRPAGKAEAQQQDGAKGQGPGKKRSLKRRRG